MQKDNLTWIFVAVLVVGVAALLIISRFGNGQPSPASTATTTAATTTEAAATSSAAVPARGTSRTTTRPAATVMAPKVAGVGPLSYLFTFKEPLVCSAKTTSPYAKRSGMVYVSGGELRGNFSGYVNGVLTDTSMIDDGTYLYAWKSGALKGLQLPAASSAAGSAIATAGGIDPAAQVSYACNPWAENSSVFVPPASVSFSNSL